MKAQHWFVIGLVTALALGKFLPELLAYDRVATSAGDWWRPFTSSFTHIDINHLLHNLLVVGIMMAAYTLDWPFADGRGLIFAELLGAVGFGMVLVIISDVNWYRGLSGVLHGSWLLMAAGYAIAPPTRWFGLFAMLMLGLKVGTELTLQAPLSMLWDMAPPYPVLVEAHAYGILAAIFAVPLLFLSQPQKLVQGPADAPQHNQEKRS